ncbi:MULTISPECIES: VOC family protein [Shimia]|uniref:VOC family protein n=1 Tax=Shimia TaxID=573139 RepID=UPI001FB1F899|nr:MULTISPECIES: VOC family protein [Shimia]MDV4144061.1 VOC family protein [Shimia sp. FJ5]
MPDPLTCCGVYPTLATPNVPETCNWYIEKLGFTLRFLYGEPPRHGAILLDQACVHFWEGTPQLGANWLYFDVSDLDILYARATENGVKITRAPETYPWGMREFNAVDLNGYHLRFGQSTET